MLLRYFNFLARSGFRYLCEFTLLVVQSKCSCKTYLTAYLGYCYVISSALFLLCKGK